MLIQVIDLFVAKIKDAGRLKGPLSMRVGTSDLFTAKTTKLNSSSTNAVYDSNHYMSQLLLLLFLPLLPKRLFFPNIISLLRLLLCLLFPRYITITTKQEALGHYL